MSGLRTGKCEVRAEMKEREVLFLSSGKEEEESQRIIAEVEALSAFNSSTCILAYMSIRGEVLTDAFLSKWLGVKRLAIPLVRGTSLELREYRPEWLLTGYKGIREPSSAAPLVEPGDVSFAIVPGLAFSEEGGRVWRMGRGKGFYDRLIPDLHCPLCGVAFPFRVLPSIPLDPWDAPLDYLCR